MSDSNALASEAVAESDEAAVAGVSVDDALPAVGASSVQSEVVAENPRDWVVRYGLPILAGLLVLHFVTRLTNSRGAA